MLVVDDEKTTVDFLKDFFEQEGFRVRTACSGQAALEAVSLLEPHIILLDVQMPGMNGMQALKQIKQTNPKIKVLMVTGENDDETIENVLQAGADYYLLKPFKLQALITQVREIVSQLA